MAGQGHLQLGPQPRFSDLVRWCTVADVPDFDLPPVPRYECWWCDEPPRIDGCAADTIWGQDRWSQPFVSVSGGADVGYNVRLAMCWDDEYLYVAFRVEDPDIRARTTFPNSAIYVLDDDVELFLDLGGTYYEVGINAVNCTYQILWTWLDPIVERGDWSALEELFKLPDLLYYTRRSTEILGRVGNRDFTLPGLQHAVRVQGSINNPATQDHGWTVELAIPWASLRALSPSSILPPEAGSAMRMQAYRIQHDWAQSGENFLGGNTEFRGYAWSVMGNTNVHNPERWATVTFVK